MVKKFLYFLASLIIILSIIVFYLTIIGHETDKLNQNIKNKINENYPKLNIELEKINLLLNPFNFTIKLKTKNPKIKSKDINIDIQEVSTEINIIAFLKKEFGINNIFFKSNKNSIKDVLKIFRLNQDSPQLYILQNILKSGLITVNAKIVFDEKGRVKNNYEIFGNIENLSLKLLNKQEIENINTSFLLKENNLKLENIKLKYSNLNIASENVSILKAKDIFYINGNFENKNSKISQNILDLISNKQKFQDVILSSKNTFDLKISKKYKISDFNIKSNINIKQALLILKNQNLKKIILELDDKILLQDHKIEFIYNKNLKLKGKGKINVKDKVDDIIYNFNNTKLDSIFDIKILFDKIPLNLDFINYKKDENVKSNLEIKIKNTKNHTQLSRLNYKSDDLNFSAEKVNFNKDFQIKDFDKINVNFRDSRNLISDLKIKKNNKIYFISANNFIIDTFVEDIITNKSKIKLKLFDDNKKTFHFKINSAYLDNEHSLLDLSGKFQILKNDIFDLDLTSNFNGNKNISLSIRTSNSTKVTTFYSELAKPFVKKFKFIKGFEDGVINFSSSNKNGLSKSILRINDFKLKELPVLTKILTLASLQGISDLLTGEGVRFDEFEMLFSNKDDLMTVNEIYSIGPAISILMEGYVQSDKLISLKGTLVPATTINKFVASIPVLGEILVGKKTGEGVFGVSFKIKGHPNDLKTSVDPIKTLTPRFITRTLEKIKKNN